MSFPFGKRRGEIGVNDLYENVMEDWRGDFAATAAFLYNADADEARIESGEGGKRPCMRGSVLVVLCCSGLTENIYSFDSQFFASSARGDDAV
jgi:hypothetical protein